MAKPLTDRIEHVVVLMLENRSFDNVLGGLYPELTKKGLYRGLLGTETNPLDPTKSGGSSVTVFQGPVELATWVMPYPDPGELYSDMVRQIFGSYSSVLPSGVLPPMSGFAWNYAQQSASPDGFRPVLRNIMQYYSGAAMPVTTYLAKQYAVCDGWFASGPVQTLANRVFTHCGTPSRLLNTNTSRISNPDYTPTWRFQHLKPPVTDTTIFELLDQRYPDAKVPARTGTQAPRVQAAPLNWKVYYHDAPLSVLCQYVYDRWDYDWPYDGNVWWFYEYTDPWKTTFESDVENGLLPKYCFIEPRYSNFWYGVVNSNHPGGAGLDYDDPNGQSLPPPINVMDGEKLLCDVYSILLKYRSVFDKTLLIVTYDEHGGLFDHIPPPPAVSPFDAPVNNFNYDRYGVRVPTILINPSITPGTIYPFPRQPHAPIARPFDHTSILSTLIAQFDLNAGLSPRVDAAPQLTDLIPASDVSYSRPVLDCPSRAPVAETGPPRPPLAAVPSGAYTLAGALGPLYQLIQTSKWRRP